MSPSGEEFVSRGGVKLSAALDAFGLEVAGLVCADFGCNVGGFTDCLLRRGARKVYAVDTGYGELAWRPRRDGRVVVMERTNALYCPAAEPVDLVVIDVGWTVQKLAIPAAEKWLKPGGRIVSLLKPHYELAKLTGHKPVRRLSARQARRTCRQVCCQLSQAGHTVLAAMVSALTGKGGNMEFFLLLGGRNRG